MELKFIQIWGISSNNWIKLKIFHNHRQPASHLLKHSSLHRLAFSLQVKVDPLLTKMNFALLLTQDFQHLPITEWTSDKKEFSSDCLLFLTSIILASFNLNTGQWYWHKESFQQKTFSLIWAPPPPPPPDEWARGKYMLNYITVFIIRLDNPQIKVQQQFKPLCVLKMQVLNQYGSCFHIVIMYC